jgi:hypothetical protein
VVIWWLEILDYVESMKEMEVSMGSVWDRVEVLGLHTTI